MRLVDEVRTAAALLLEAFDSLPERLDSWALSQHQPGEMDEGVPWCFRCRQAWPCDKLVRLDEDIKARRGEQ